MATGSATEFCLDEGALTHLLSFLDAPSLCSASMTCKSWNEAAQDDRLWRSLHSKASNPMVNCGEMRSTSTCCQLTEPGKNPSVMPSVACSSEAETSWKGPTFKKACATGCNWRTGRAGRVLAKFPGSSWNSAARLHPDCDHAVLASAGLGSVDVVHLRTGDKCSQFQGLARQSMEVDPGELEGDALDALYSSVAISPSCCQVAFGGFDGVIRLFDIKRGSLLASATVLAALQPAVTALGFCSIQSTQVMAAGLADGRLALSPLQAWQVCLGSPACGLHGGSCNRVGCHSEEGLSSSSYEPREVYGPWLTCSLGAGVEVRRIKGECGAGAGLAVVAGTSGGHVKVVDGAAGRVRSSLVGSCSCPVKCLSLHNNGEGAGIPEPGWTGPARGAPLPRQRTPHELASVVYAGFNHSMLGNGHYNAVFVWDVNSSERVALLHPGDLGLRSHRGGRGVCCRRLSSYDTSGMVQSVWADGWKVAVSAGRGVTVFETRTWRPLYKLSIPVSFSEAQGRESSGSNCGTESAASAFGPLQQQQQHEQQRRQGHAEGVDCKGARSCGGTSTSMLGIDVFPEQPMLKGSQEAMEAPSQNCWNMGRCASLSPAKTKSSPERGRCSTEKAKMELEEVSLSPGSLIFYGSTLAVGLKGEKYALVSFQDEAWCKGDGPCTPDVHVKKLS